MKAKKGMRKRKEKMKQAAERKNVEYEVVGIKRQEKRQRLAGNLLTVCGSLPGRGGRTDTGTIISW